MAAGTTPDSSDVLMMYVKTAASMSMFYFSRLVSIGSRAQDLADYCKMIRLIYVVVANVDSQSCADW